MDILFKEIEKWSKIYEFSFQFWGDANNNFWIYKGGTELCSKGGFETSVEAIKEALSFIYRVNRVKKVDRVF